MQADIKLKYPSANALVVFDVASRHLNFTHAAHELRTTRVAVSSQIRQLESQLGCALFVRHHRGLKLTHAGEILADAVTPSFETIARALGTLTLASTDNQLSVSVSHGMSSHWLMPRIHRFRKAHPDVDFRFQVTDAYVDLDVAGVDVALRYGDGPWKGVQAKRLLRVQRFPVCSPTYVERSGTLNAPADLCNHTLLYLSGHYGPLTHWVAWLKEIGFDSITCGGSLTFDDQNSLIEAVLAGEGIALAGPPQVSEYLRDGRLCRVLTPYFTEQKLFWSVRPENRPVKPLALAFEAWLAEEMRGSLAVVTNGAPSTAIAG